MINYISRLFDNLNEIVYLIDADTNALVYMNKYALSLYAGGDASTVIGKPCYEVLRNAASPCASCKNSCLGVGEFHEWKYYSDVLNKFLSKKNTIIEIDGKRYLLGMAFDMTAQIEQEEVIQSMLITEAMINEVLSEALREEDPTLAIDVFLRLLGERTKSERVYIFEESPDGNYVINTFEWTAEGVTAEKEKLQMVSMEIVKHWYNRFEQDRNVVIADVESLKELDPLVYNSLSTQGIHSLVVSPLIIEDKIIGFYGTDNPPAELMHNIQDMAWIIGHFLVSLLKKRELIAHLAELSYFEQLTGFQNRHAMEAYINHSQTAESIGIIYCDVMGLKKINDSEGHQAGDALLLRASDCLKKHFARTELYRIGGDEFLVICEGIDKGDFNARIETLRYDMAQNNAMMALGSIWCEQTDDIEKLIIDADKLMYAEKQAYYAEAAKNGLIERRCSDRRADRSKGLFCKK